MRILIVSYYFPPRMNVGGFRALSWASTWAAAGHDVLVVTSDGSESGSCQFFEAEEPGGVEVRRIANPVQGAVNQGYARGSAGGGGLAAFAKRNLPILDSNVLWARRALRSVGDAARERGRFDLIVSTSFPLSAHLVARHAKRRLGGIWIADFRDYFGQFESNRLGEEGARSRLIRRFARRVGAEADLVTTVSPTFARFIARATGAPRVETVYNGYFESNLPDSRSERPARRILYTGSWNPAEFSIEPLAEALRILKGRGVELPEVAFTGQRFELLAGPLEAVGARASFLGTMPNREILQLQADSALLFLCDAMSGSGVLLTKTFEYMAARRPILTITRPDSELSRTIFAKPARGYCLGLDPGRIADFVEDCLAGRRGGDGDFYGRDEIAAYSRERQADLLLKIAENIHVE